MMSTLSDMTPIEAPVRLPPLWMVCSSAALPGLGPGRTHRPGGEQHARQMGSLTTLCGRIAANWVNFYDRPFDGVHPDSCPACRDLIAAHRAIRN